MSTSAPSGVTNATVEASSDILALTRDESLFELLEELHVNWETRTVNQTAAVYQLLVSHGFVEHDTLTRAGLLFYSRLVLPFDELREDGASSLKGGYRLTRTMSVGKNSAIFEAVHEILGTKVVVKLLRPGASQDIISSLRKIAAAGLAPNIIQPTDFVSTTAIDVFGNAVPVDALIFPFATGVTFREFLRQSSTFLNSHVVLSFIDQVGRALASLEAVGAYHGDLHDQNILVDYEQSRGVRFKLIDISFDAMGSLSLEVCHNNDLLHFKNHIWRLLSAQKDALRRLSLRKYLGTRVYQEIDDVLSPATSTFRRVLEIVESDSWYSRYLADKERFVANHFGQPGSFRLQRYEEITDPVLAAELFVPFPELMSRIQEFGNIFVSGNRGSGKSTYLAALAFAPSISEPIVSFADSFGIYFPCRQGEFMVLAGTDGRNPAETGSRTLHVLGVKIMRRTLEGIATGIAHARIARPSDVEPLIQHLNQFMPSPGIVRVEARILSEIDNLVSSLVKLELEEVSNFSQNRPFEGQLLRAADLQSFFEIVRKTFPELSVTRFHILFDDAGEPYTPPLVQRAMNDLMLASNPVFCVKFSAERFTFEFLSSEHKVLEDGHDYVSYDISATLFIGAWSAGLQRDRLERYFREIVEARLRSFDYRSDSIVEYLGDDPNGSERLVGLLAAGRRDAYYCGWTTVWNIADRTPRNLLELVSEIFSVGNIDSRAPPAQVSMRDQDRAIRTISDKRLQSLSQISGAIDIDGKRESLGRHLFEVTATIGSTFRTYIRQQHRAGLPTAPSRLGLTRAAQRRQRVRQTLAIERNDSEALSKVATYLLERLVTFGILDDAKSAYARDDQRKKPLYVLNRIYCPAFQISYVRDEHLRLSKQKFEMLLVSPELFSREGTKRLRDQTASGGGNNDLFGFDLYE